MKKIVWTFGLISGFISAAMMGVTMPLSGHISYGASLTLGYTSLVAAYLLVYFGIRSYRDNAAGGTISFGRAFAVGALISLISCAFYVVTWEIVYFNFMPDYMVHYNQHVLDKARAAGATAAALQAKAAELEQARMMYNKPLVNVGFTLMECAPVALVVTLISAAVLRRREARVVAAA